MKKRWVQNIYEYILNRFRNRICLYYQMISAFRSFIIRVYQIIETYSVYFNSRGQWREIIYIYISRRTSHFWNCKKKKKKQSKIPFLLSRMSLSSFDIDSSFFYYMTAQNFLSDFISLSYDFGQFSLYFLVLFRVVFQGDYFQIVEIKHKIEWNETQVEIWPSCVCVVCDVILNHFNNVDNKYTLYSRKSDQRCKVASFSFSPQALFLPSKTWH